MSAIQPLTYFSSPNVAWSTYQMGYVKRVSSSSYDTYSGNKIVPVNIPAPTTFEIYFNRVSPDHTGILEYSVNDNLYNNALSSGIGEYKVRTINVNSWSGISNIQFGSAIYDSSFSATLTPSEWKVYADGVLIYYHGFDRR